MTDTTPLTKESCYRNCRELPVVAGEDTTVSTRLERTTGTYYRNTRFKKEFSPLFENDAERTYGYRIKAPFLKFDPPDEMSVNCVSCTSCIECSPILQTNHPNPPSLDVAVINLDLLRQKFGILAADITEDCDLPFVQYSPIVQCDSPPHPGNPCHFNLMLDIAADTEKIYIRRVLQEIDFGESSSRVGKKVPTTDADIAEVLDAVNKHAELISFKRDVISQAELQNA